MKLLPCPFCGAKQSVNIGATGVWVFPYRDIISGKIIKWGVQCSDCFSESRSSFKKDVAINNWNHRAEYKLIPKYRKYLRRAIKQHKGVSR